MKYELRDMYHTTYSYLQRSPLSPLFMPSHSVAPLGGIAECQSVVLPDAKGQRLQSSIITGPVYEPVDINTNRLSGGRHSRIPQRNQLSHTVSMQYITVWVILVE